MNSMTPVIPASPIPSTTLHGGDANTIPVLPAPTSSPVRIPTAGELALRRALRIGNTHTYSMAQLIGIYPA